MKGSALMESSAVFEMFIAQCESAECDLPELTAARRAHNVPIGLRSEWL